MKIAMDQETHVQQNNDDNDTGYNKCNKPEEHIRINKDGHCMANNNYPAKQNRSESDHSNYNRSSSIDNDDDPNEDINCSNENHSKYENETINQEVYNSNDNYDDHEKSISLSDHSDDNTVGNNSQSSELEKEDYTEQSLDSDVEHSWKESNPKYKNKTIDQGVRSNDNYFDDSEKLKSLSDHKDDNNIGSNSQSSELEEENYLENVVVSDVEQPVLSQNKKRSVELHKLRTQSLERRKCANDDLLMPGISTTAIIVDASPIEDDDKFQANKTPHGIHRRICLNPKFRLHTQLLIVFGCLSAFTFACVLIVAVIISWQAGENLKSINEAGLKDLVSRYKGSSAQLLAQSLTHMLVPIDVFQILHDSTRERFAGYPNDGDEYVPFFDIDSQTNKYPVLGVTGKPLPLDWQIEGNVNDDNYEEHVQGRWSIFNIEPALSTTNAVYLMQGMCDPTVTDPSTITYWENCTEANNDILTGGTINPSATNNQIYRKASSLSPILKALFESHQDVYEIGIYFSNDGAGSVVTFPHYQLRTGNYYTSIGCEWMREPNPYDTSKPIGTDEMIDKCHPEGTPVSSRIYNPLERDWFRRQALNPFVPIVDGPYLSAWRENKLVMSIGQGVYDDVTNKFIGCAYVGLYLANVEDLLNKSRVTKNSEISVARFDDGTTVASTAWDSSTATETIKIYDLNVGITFESYEALTSLVDYNTTWDPTEVSEKYDKFAMRHDGFLVAIHPIPPIPESYNRSYTPHFFAILSVSEADLFQVVKDVQENFDEHVIQIMYRSLLVGVICLGIVFIIIYLTSKAVTAPLEYMNTVANTIINHFGSTSLDTNNSEILNQTPTCSCSPRTELDEVVKEFNKMVTSFEFSSVAKSVKDGREEIRNEFNMQNEFQDLYESRKEAKFCYNVGRNGSFVDDNIQFKHLGSKIDRKPTSILIPNTQRKGGASSLFVWTFLMIGTPLLLIPVIISGMVMYNLSKELHSGIEEAEAYFLEVELQALSLYTTLWAQVVSSLVSKPIRDLHLLTRYAGWLLFGGVERAVSFTQVKTGVEQCKTFSNTAECPFYEENYFCDCSWNVRDSTCNHYRSDTRHRQDLYFVCEASDTFPNGDRNSTNFPNVSYSPDTTLWWDDLRTLPGFEKGASASGYETTYDRLRVISASPLHQVVYNQDVEKEYIISNNVAFEADGMYVTFASCTSLFLEASKWSSTMANGASELRPDLCPLGKYGYDPRCREWYDTGKKLAENDGIPLYVTAPYVFADDNAEIGQSATSPLIDPRTNEHVGQVLIDFKSITTLDFVVDKNSPLTGGAFPILITTLSSADSVVGPGFSYLKEPARPISELVLPGDYSCKEKECKIRRRKFKEIVSSMKKGESGITNFTRRSSTGTVETVHMAYAPIIVRGYRPLNSSDFSRGVESHEFLIYSLALAQIEEGILQTFEDIKAENSRKITKSVDTLSVIMFVCIIFTLFIMGIVILSMIEPVLELLEVIKSINHLDATKDPPIINHSIGSWELNSVSDTIETLYKMARCGNYAFLSGDLKQAYTVIHEASYLFHRLNNKKAVGIVSNNLGNLLLCAYRAMDEATEDDFCGMTKTEVINKGISLYYDAIQVGEEIYDEFQAKEGWSLNCLTFMQHLSNRYFNRGMFLLTVKDGHKQPEELEKLGYRDLDIAADLDVEIAQISLKEGLGLEKNDVDLGRANGHLTLQEIGYPDTWDVEERLHKYFLMVKKEMQKGGAHSSLFDTISTSGRLQEIETELIRYKLLKNEFRLAAQIGIRMLIEDEYIFVEAQEKALEALWLYYNQSMEEEDLNDKNVNHRQAINSMTTLSGVIGSNDDGQHDDEESLTNLLRPKRYSNMTHLLMSFSSSSRGYLKMEGL